MIGFETETKELDPSTDVKVNPQAIAVLDAEKITRQIMIDHSIFRLRAQLAEWRLEEHGTKNH